MARDRYNYQVSRAQAKPATQRIIVALLILTGLTLLVLAKAQHPTLLNLRLRMLDMLRPVMTMVSQPVTATRKLATQTGEVLDTAEENRRLRAENETLRHWQSVAQALRAENEALRRLQSYHPVEAASYVTARVIGQSPSTFGQFLTVNAGASDGVKTLQPVVDAYGLVGRTLEVSDRTTRVMLLSDVGSRVPVILGNTRQRAILSGTGGELLRLSFMADGAKPALGEAVVTTQEGGLIPGGIKVGSVFKKDGNGFLVKPLRPLAQGEYMRVVVPRAAAPQAQPVPEATDAAPEAAPRSATLQ